MCGRAFRSPAICFMDIFQTETHQMSIIEIKNLTKKFEVEGHTVTALDGVTLRSKKEMFSGSSE